MTSLTMNYFTASVKRRFGWWTASPMGIVLCLFYFFCSPLASIL